MRDLFAVGVLCVLWQILVNPGEEVPAPVLFWIGVFVIPFPYWLLSNYAGVSPGKALVGLRVRDDETGEAPRGASALVRAAVAMLGALSFEGVWWVHQRLGAREKDPGVGPRVEAIPDRLLGVPR